jgi:L-amino acid N-acyltransferase YncA
MRRATTGSSGGASAPANAYAPVADLSQRAVLRDGAAVRVRAIRADDKQRLREAFERLSPETIYRRFLHPKNALTADELRTATELDFQDHVSIGVTVGNGDDERFVAVGRFVRSSHAADTAELAITVVDGFQRHGAGTLLVERLVAVARESGVRQLVAHVLENNRAMLRFLSGLDLPAARSYEGGVYRIVLDLTGRAQGAGRQD